MSAARKKIIERIFEVIIFLFFIFVVVIFLTGVTTGEFRLFEIKPDSGAVVVMVWQTLVVAAAYFWFWKFYNE